MPGRIIGTTAYAQIMGFLLSLCSGNYLVSSTLTHTCTHKHKHVHAHTHTQMQLSYPVHAPGGRRVLDGLSLRPSRAWLLVPGRLSSLRQPLQDAAILGLGAAPSNTDRGMASQPESRWVLGN